MEIAFTTTASNQSYWDNIGKGWGNIGKGWDNILKIYSCKNFFLNFGILLAILYLYHFMKKTNSKYLIFDAKLFDPSRSMKLY